MNKKNSSKTHNNRPNRIGTNKQACYLAKTVSVWNNRGSASAEAIQTALKDLCREPGMHFHFYGERHHYAHDRYTELWKEKTGKEVQCPAVADVDRKTQWLTYAQQITGMTKEEVNEIDKEIQMEISEALGHGREKVTRYYLGQCIFKQPQNIEWRYK